MLPIKYIHPVMLLDMEDIPYHSLETVPFYTVYSCIVTCSRHLNLTDFEVGASCSIALKDKAKTGYPRPGQWKSCIQL